jgi:GWxTD domain-containing protein
VQWISEGLYVITTDTASTYGLPVLRTYATYPEITQPEHVLKPLRYLTSKEEYDRLVKNENTKKAVDDYWLRAASTPAHAREVLKAFYTGVSYANKFFTTTREGWKTDRGMVYCIFGQPYSVYRSGNSETWMYGTSNTPFTPVFTFEKHTDGLAGEDYFLRRSDLLKPYWYEMVENWRNGRLPY